MNDCPSAADEATEPIVDAALSAGKPFAIVPCCVCPNTNLGRKLPDGSHVRLYEQFCEYLTLKHPGIRSVQLPFEGAWANGEIETRLQGGISACTISRVEIEILCVGILMSVMDALVTKEGLHELWICSTSGMIERFSHKVDVC